MEGSERGGKSNKKFFGQSQSEIRNRSEEESWGTPVDYTSIFFHSPSSFISPLKILGKSRSDNNKTSGGEKREQWLFESKTVGLAPLNLLNFESGKLNLNWIDVLDFFRRLIRDIFSSKTTLTARNKSLKF